MSSESYEEQDNTPDKIANCIRNVANFSRVQNFHLLDKGNYNPSMLMMYLKEAAPKVEALFEKIEALDKQDYAKEGKLYKHMIFTDIKNSAYGAKLLASTMHARGFTPAFHVQGPGFTLHPEETLLKTQSGNFGLLMSKTVFDRSMNVKFKKSQLELFNRRPDNVNGDYMRFIILDQGFKEGIDLFDVKYVHLFEPLLVRSDEKQAIGRGTRFCGQKGLEFHPRFGWPLYVFRYEVSIPKEHQKRLSNAKQMLELYLEYANIDIRKIVFAAELEKAAIDAAVDKKLTAPVHQFKIEQPPQILKGGADVSSSSKKPKAPTEILALQKMHNYIDKRFSKFTYPKVVLQNNCVDMSGGALVQFTPTQDFIRHFFQADSAYKGMLLWHSVGTGKTCTAIATATTSFENEGYSILWVTRHTLKSDIWKNMFKQVCSLSLQDKELPNKIGNPMKHVSDRWMEPISYKQFSNMLLKKNKIYDEIVKRNGTEDPLKKTLIIIDEAHKLYSPTVVGSEKPNTDILEEMIHNSYKVSGKDSVRVLAMTATPYTEDGIEMVKLLNLLREKDPLPIEFNDFAKNFLDLNGYFTNKGLSKFQDKISGYISYLNRSQDARNFAHPVLQDVYVDLTSREEEVKEVDEDGKTIKEKMVGKYEREMNELKPKLKEAKEVIKNQANEVKIKGKVVRARIITKAKDDLAKAKEQKKEDVEKCKSLKVKERKECKDSANTKFVKEQLRIAEDKEKHLEKCIPKIQPVDKESLLLLEDEKAQLKGYIDMHRKQVKEWNKQLKEDRPIYKQNRNELKEDKKEILKERAKLKKIKDKEDKKKATKEFRQTKLKEYNNKRKELKTLRFKISDLQIKKKVLRIQLEKAKLQDVSQFTALQKRCSL
jgi:hypothetical protein